MLSLLVRQDHFSVPPFFRFSCFGYVCGRAKFSALSAFLAFLLGSLLLTGEARACPICGVPTVTLSERYARADVALLVEWVSARPSKGQKPESTTFEIVQVQRDLLGTYTAGSRISVESYTQGKAGDLFLLLGSKDEKQGVKWQGLPFPVTETSFQYIVQAPPPESAAEKRLGYFVKFLEFSDLTIANDAFAEFVNAPTKDIVAIAERLPKDKLRRWLADAKTPISRQAGYGLMLGLCGGADEARFLEKRIMADDPDRQIGLEGLMFGYLLLTGDEGLDVLEKTWLANPEAEDGAVYPAVKAVRYYWSYGNGKIPPERLQAAMRPLVDRPALADSALTDLARWKDWSLQERLMELYGTGNFESDDAKKAIIEYLIASTKDLPKDAKEPPEHVVAGRKHLEELRRRDPKLVATAEKYFLLK